MPNSNPQAVLVANSKIRPLADRIGQLYWRLKAAQSEATAEAWLTTLFPADAEIVVDGSAVDGRTPITDNDVRAFVTLAGAFITFMEQSASANLLLTMKIAPNPEG